MMKYLKRITSLVLSLLVVCTSFAWGNVVTTATAGETAVVSVDGITYSTFADALEAAEEADTIVLLDAVELGDTYITKDITIDLNGKELKAGSFITLCADIVDHSADKSGLFVCEKLKIPNNSQMPIYDSSAGGYRFAKVEYYVEDITDEPAKTKHIDSKIHIFENYENIYNAIAGGYAKSRIQLGVLLRWNNGEKEQYCYFKDDMVSAMYDVENPCAVRIQLAGLSDYEDLTATPIVVSDAGVVSEYGRNLTIQAGMDVLSSNVHRKVPTEFEKSSALDDLIYYETMSSEEAAITYDTLKRDATVVCNLETEDFITGVLPLREDFKDYGSYTITDVEDQDFKKAVQISCTTVPESDSKFIIFTSATPKVDSLADLSSTEKMLIKLSARCISGGDENGNGKIKVQIQHPDTKEKSLFQEIEVTKEWSTVYLPFYGVENATDIGIRAGYYEQVVEVGGVEILNFGENYDVSLLPHTLRLTYDDFDKDAQWRKDALDRIEKIRKGDFAVIVKDKDGNVVPNAEVEFDMFEHEFLFGSAVSNNLTKAENSTLQDKFSINFNSVVNTTNFKWQNLIKRPGYAKAELLKAMELGAKHIRGHMLFSEQSMDGNEANRFPDYMCTEEVLGNKELFLTLCEEHVKDVAEQFKEFDIEYVDVLNELLLHSDQSTHFGKDIWAKYYEFARKYFPEGTKLYYNENDGVLTQDYIALLDQFIELGVDFDGLGIQSHYDGDFYEPSKQVALYQMLGNRYNKELQVTEYTCGVTDQIFQANYTRDTLIAAFAEPRMTAFFTWRFEDQSADKKTTFMYDENWELKPAGKVYQDLVYNKWWTRDAKSSTNENGVASIRGFYGDYDVTVTVDGKTTTSMVAFHKGYENILEIVVE